MTIWILEFLGSRYVTDKDDVCKEEDMILADYLSNCTFDASKKCVVLPEKELPKGFCWTFFRKAEERMFSATVDEERFTVIVLDETGWDSDVAARRDQKQVCNFNTLVLYMLDRTAHLDHKAQREKEIGNEFIIHNAIGSL